MLKVRCPHCKSVLQLTEQFAGRVVACAQCRKSLRVPAGAASTALPAKSETPAAPAKPPPSPPPAKKPTAEQPASPAVPAAVAAVPVAPNPAPAVPAKLPLPAPAAPPVARAAEPVAAEAAAPLPLAVPVLVEPEKPPVPPAPPVAPAPPSELVSLAPDPLVKDFLRQGGAGEPESLAEMPCEPLPEEHATGVRTVGQPVGSLSFEGERSRLLRWSLYAAVTLTALAAFVSIFLVHNSAPAALPLTGLFTAVPVLLAGVLVLTERSTVRGTLWICPGGVIWLLGKRAGFCRWQQVKGFRIGMTPSPGAADGHRRLSYVLTTNTDVRISFNSDEVFGALTAGEYIQQQTTRVLLPIYLERLRRGERLDFGAIAVDRKTIGVKGQKTSWQEVAEVKVEDGKALINLLSRAHGAAIPVMDISHPEVFLGVTTNILSSRSRPSTGTMNIAP
jgi:hypothetical protein